MTSGQKIAFSFLGSMILFAGFFVFSKLVLFDELELRYYSQSKVREKTESLDKISEGLDTYITKFLDIIELGEDAFLNKEDVKSYGILNPSEKQIGERRALTENLFQNYPEITGIRIIGKNKKDVYYSSFDKPDLKKEDGIIKTYNYYDVILNAVDELDVDKIAIDENKPEHKIILDVDRKRLVLSFPMLDGDNAFAATAVFYFDFTQIQNYLLEEKIIDYGQNLSLYEDKSGRQGIVVNVPVKYYEDFGDSVLNHWAENKKNSSDTSEVILSAVDILPEKVMEIDDGRYWVILDSEKANYLNVSGVYINDIFEISKELKYLIYGAAALTIFLIVFLILSFQRDKKTVIQKKIKKLQYSIITEYLNNKEKIEWSEVQKRLGEDKNTLSRDILKAVGVRNEKRAKKLNLDEYLEQLWKGIFDVIGSKSDGTNVNVEKIGGNEKENGSNVNASPVSLDDIKNALKDVLKETKLNVQVDSISDAVKTSAKKVKPVTIPQESLEAEEVEEIEEISEVEEVEAIEEISDAEEVEEIEEISDAEEVGEIEEISDAEEVEAIEEISEAEEVEEIEEVSEAEEVEEMEEVSDAEEVEEIEEISEAEEVEEIEEISDAEEVEEIEEVSEAEEVEEIEEISEVEDVEEIEEISDAEELEDLIPEPDPLAFVKVMNGGIQYEYKESNDSFIRSEKFATVENLFGEEITMGFEYTRNAVTEESAEIPFTAERFEPVLDVPKPLIDIDEVPSKIDSLENKISGTPLIQDNTPFIAEELEELSDADLYPTNSGFFSMTQFGANTNNVQDLEAAAESIVEENGVYSIADNLEVSDVILDPAFKKLVDSVIK